MNLGTFLAEVSHDGDLPALFLFTVKKAWDTQQKIIDELEEKIKELENKNDNNT